MDLMGATNIARIRVWQRLAKKERQLALIDTDGTIAPTTGECKAGMDISYKGTWGYAPLVVTLANTQEVLFVKNRPGEPALAQRSRRVHGRRRGAGAPGSKDASRRPWNDCGRSRRPIERTRDRIRPTVWRSGSSRSDDRRAVKRARGRAHRAGPRLTQALG